MGAANCFEPADAATCRKLSLQVAIEIEEDLLRNGWSKRQLLGSQAAIQQRFGIGRWAFRETARVLEMRGSARLKRGVRGGLWSLVPGMDNFARQLTAFLIVSRGDRDIMLGAMATVGRIARCQANGPITAFLAELFERVWSMLPDENVALRYRGFGETVPEVSPPSSLNEFCYAQQLVFHIIDDFINSDERHPRWVGSETDLALRYGFSREIVRQASRTLEGMELIDVRIGRNGGLYTRVPRLTFSRAQLFSYLSVRGGSAEEARTCAALVRAAHNRPGHHAQHLVLEALLPLIDDFADWASPVPDKRRDYDYRGGAGVTLSSAR